MSQLFTWFTLLLAVFIPAVTKLPGDGPALGLALSGLFLLCAMIVVALALTSSRRAPTLTKPLAFWIGALYVIVQVVGSLRATMSPDPGIAANSLRTVIFVAVGCFSVLGWRLIGRGSAFAAVMHALGAYCLSNLLLWLIGISNPGSDMGTATEPATLLSFFGINMRRVMFPMGWGVNTFAVIAGSVLTFGLVKVRFSRTRRLSNLCFLVLCPLICCVLSDSRGAILFAGAAAVSAMIAPRLSTWGMVLFWCAATAVVLGADVLGDLTFGSRQGVSTLSGRELVWATGVTELADFKLDHVFGYGLYGQFSSGVSAIYGVLFSGFTESPEYITLHNTYLQSVFDTGYFGLALLLLFVFSSSRRLARTAATSRRWEYFAALASVSFLAGQGLTEVTLAFYQPWVILMLLAVVVDASADHCVGPSRAVKRPNQPHFQHPIPQTIPNLGVRG